MTSVYLYITPLGKGTSKSIYGVVAGSRSEAYHLILKNTDRVKSDTTLTFIGKLDEIKDEVEDAEDQVARVHPWSEEP